MDYGSNLDQIWIYSNTLWYINTLWYSNINIIIIYISILLNRRTMTALEFYVLKDLSNGKIGVDHAEVLLNKIIETHEEAAWKARETLLEGVRILKELVDKQQEYIEFLGEEINNAASYLEIHGIGCTDFVYKRGIKLREEIEQLKKQLQ